MRIPTRANATASMRRIVTGRVRTDTRAPSWAPARMRAPIRAVVVRSTCPRAKNVRAPTSVEIERTKCEGAVATCTGKLSTTMRNGTWMIPRAIPKTLASIATSKLTTTPDQEEATLRADQRSERTDNEPQENERGAEEDRDLRRHRQRIA